MKNKTITWKYKYQELKVSQCNVKKIEDPASVVGYMADDGCSLTEEMYILIMNTQNEIIEKHLVAKGAVNFIMVTAAEVFRPLLIRGGVHLS